MSYNLTTVQVTILIVLAIWELIWKGLALWRAAQRRQLYWFVAILIVNSAGILPIVYLLTNKPQATDARAAGASS